MTTIIATREAIYADSRLVVGDDTMHCKKIFRAPDGSLYATAGDSRLTSYFEAAIAGGEVPEYVPPNEDENFEGVVLSKEGLFYYDRSFSKTEVTNSFVCIGTGWPVAKSWMLEGCDPATCIDKAALIYKTTGGPVQSMRLDEPQRRKNARKVSR